MIEMKAVSFVIIDSTGKCHRVAFDVLDGEKPKYELRGDPAILLNHWDLISRRVEFFLKGQLK